MRRRRSPASRLAAQAFGLSMATPQVVAHRMHRLAHAAQPMSAGDLREFASMGNEKIVAFYQAWSAMWMTCCRVQFQLAQDAAVTALRILYGRPGAMPALALANAGARILAAGVAPVHSKAVANAKRLSRRRL